MYYNVSMTIAELLQQQQADRADSLGVEVLLAHVLGVSRAYLMAHPEHQMKDGDELRFGELYARLREGEPVAYLTGVKEFYDLNFFVNSSVLIPRPETELLVEKVVDFVGDKPLKIMDVGTGSGAIAVALAKNLPKATVVGIDVSEDALIIARKNTEYHGVSVDFQCGDLLEGVNEPFDVVVANLPYIGEEQYRFVSRETEKYEPSVALFGGSDGLQLYKRFFEQLSQSTWKPRLLLGEFGFAQGEKMTELLNTFFEHEDWRIEKDYALIERIFMVTFPSYV